MNSNPKLKNKTFSMRVSDDFLETVDELSAAFGMNKTEVVEFAIRLFPTLAGQNKDGEHE